MSKESLLPLMAAALLCSALPAWSQESPEGQGKELAAALCNSCHPFYARLGGGYTAEGWRTVMRMMANHGVNVRADQVAAITEYLTKNFPEKGKPAGVVIPGPAKVSIKAWQAPTPGSRPHDPLAAADGSLWYTGQMNNVLGRLDPKTGRIKEYALKTAHSGPHGLDEDKDGNIWYTGNTGALIGKLDPKTGAVTEYKMPDPDVKDPHTLIFDRSGILWFVAQNANRVGRLDPKTGEIKLLTPPTPKARPYGMAVNSKGTVFFVEFGTSKVGSVDPKTLEIREYPLPDSASQPTAHHDRQRRHRLVQRLLTRLSGSSRSRDRHGDRVAVSERAEGRALRHLGDQRHHLVQRVRVEPECGGALRSQDCEIPGLGDPGWWQHRAQHLGHAGRRLRGGQQLDQCRDPDQNLEVKCNDKSL